MKNINVDAVKLAGQMVVAKQELLFNMYAFVRNGSKLCMAVANA